MTETFTLIADIEEHSFQVGPLGAQFNAVASSEGGVLTVGDPEIVATLSGRPDLWDRGLGTEFTPPGPPLTYAGLLAHSATYDDVSSDFPSYRRVLLNQPL